MSIDFRGKVNRFSEDGDYVKFRLIEKGIAIRASELNIPDIFESCSKKPGKILFNPGKCK